MKKKKQNSITGAAATTADLKSLIHDHALFFDKLVELIPAKFYLPNDDDDSKPWFQGLSKTARASAKQQTRENIKKSRRDRLDPEKSQNSTLDILKHSLENQTIAKNPNPSSGDDEENNEEIEVKPITNNVTYEELRQKLHRKIELLRGNRGGSEKSKGEKKEYQENKRKRNTESEGKGEIGNGDNGRAGNLGKGKEGIGKSMAEATKGIEFGKVKIGGNEDEFGRKKKKKKVSKVKELERAKRLEEVKKQNPVVAEKESWRAATSRAMGVKVHDDPRLLKESMKKEKKRHEKNAEKWKERVESREKVKGEKQAKRAENISDRIQQKKMRKIAKREKKLMRPGFEGRKEGYINED
ncbi:unnamed protein product [Ilex paraguariensis]|uniref:Ribosomal RNA-processing protein 14/surfeit locus protein 6 C-terminal domain-containing protein n=1 Tax=Ilex paraguariensis TaxID=185542 RepID=A0ABC8SRZ9_9AQUA